jgi:hypothetical protein
MAAEHGEHLIFDAHFCDLTIWELLERKQQLLIFENCMSQNRTLLRLF